MWGDNEKKQIMSMHWNWWLQKQMIIETCVFLKKWWMNEKMKNEMKNEMKNDDEEWMIEDEKERKMKRQRF